MTIAIGFGILIEMDIFPSNSSSIKWRTPVFLCFVFLLFVVLAGLSLFILHKKESPSTIIPPGWKQYDGGKYVFAYPPSWALKIGFNFKSDVAVYEPTMKKRWIGQTGQQVDWPLHYIDVVSVLPSTKTASDIVDDYQQAWQVSASQINRQMQFKNGSEYELYGVVGVNTVIYQNIAISHGNMLALLESSLSSLADASIENTILSTFQFK